MLNNDILHQIFQYALHPPYGPNMSVLEVSKTWRDVATETSLWKTITVDLRRGESLLPNISYMMLAFKLGGKQPVNLHLHFSRPGLCNDLKCLPNEDLFDCHLDHAFHDEAVPIDFELLVKRMCPNVRRVTHLAVINHSLQWLQFFSDFIDALGDMKAPKMKCAQIGLRMNNSRLISRLKALHCLRLPPKTFCHIEHLSVEVYPHFEDFWYKLASFTNVKRLGLYTDFRSDMDEIHEMILVEMPNVHTLDVGGPLYAWLPNLSLPNVRVVNVYGSQPFTYDGWSKFTTVTEINVFQIPLSEKGTNTIREWWPRLEKIGLEAEHSTESSSLIKCGEPLFDPNGFVMVRPDPKWNRSPKPTPKEIKFTYID